MIASLIKLNVIMMPITNNNKYRVVVSSQTVSMSKVIGLKQDTQAEIDLNWNLII